MTNGTIAPSHLHHLINTAKKGDESVRMEALQTVLTSGNLAVIRRIVELKPFNQAEKDLVLEKVGELTGSEDVSNKDFGFHLLVSSEIDSTKVLSLLEQNKTFSRSALDHIRQMFGSNVPEAFVDYQYEVAEDLLQSDRIPSRDRGCHMLITLAGTPEEWHDLADRLTDEEDIWDLRQRVLERFLSDCKDETAIKLFVDRVVEYCMTKINEAVSPHEVASHMHWIITSLKRIGATGDLEAKGALFQQKFGYRLPRSIWARIKGREPIVSSFYDDYGYINMGW